jgi:hypothetical protein
VEKDASASEEIQMFKRALVAFTFVIALGTGGLGIGSKAMAWSDCHSDVVAYPYDYYPSYSGYAVYRGYAPRVAYYPTYPVRSYPVFYGRTYGRDYDRDYHHHRHHDNGLTISFGF